MKKQKPQARKFSGMGYREVQRFNSVRRSQLPKSQQLWLKKQGYKNIGWNYVIQLYQKLNDLCSQSHDGELSLEELFLEADRIGQKYQTQAEIKQFNQEMSTLVNDISQLIDQQFPDHEVEIIDFKHKLQ